MTVNFCIIGGGIVGLSAACALADRFPGRSIVLIEKEQELATHQTGHNSGVIHAGIYYKAGSLKAKLCRDGAEALRRFCTEHGVPFETRGKLVVATRDDELARLPALQQNAAQNGILTTMLDADELAAREPNVSGSGALLVPDSGIVDYRKVAAALARRLQAAGGRILAGDKVIALQEEQGTVIVECNSSSWRAQQLIVCGGLQADRLARLAGLNPKGRIVPFRGEYYLLPAELSRVVHHMIYPVPDPELPFLGIHLTPTIDGSMTVGPNAVLGLSREGYPRWSLAYKDAVDTLAHPGFWRLAGKHWKSGISEMKSSLSRRHYLAECRRYCPSLELADLLPKEAGIRAQFVTDQGEMFHDFKFLETERMLHVCNAPSPAATSCLLIGQHIAERVATRMV